MKANDIFRNIQGLNPRTNTVSSLGTYVSEQAEQIAENCRREVLAIVPQASIAYKILSGDQKFLTEKQMWCIAYELLKNEAYCKKLACEMSVEQQIVDNVRSNSVLKVGTRVRNKHYGDGVVVEKSKKRIAIKFDGDDKISTFEKSAKFEKI